MLAEFSIVPIGKGESLGALIAEITKIVERSRLSHKLTAMGTIVQGDWDSVMALIKKCHARAMSNGRRVMTHINIDDRKGVRNPMAHKVESIERRLGHAVAK